MDKPYYERMHERLKGSYAREMKKLRQSTVEPVLGTLINFMGMRRINTRGIKLANKGMITAAIAYNLKKLINFPSKCRTNVRSLQINIMLNGFDLPLFFNL